MTSREASKENNLWTKTVKFFKSPFQRKRKDEELSDSEDYDSSSEDDLDYLDSQKDRLAFTSSQARFVTPENKPTNLRYQLRRNPKPSLKAQEAQAQLKPTARNQPKAKRPVKVKVTKPKIVRPSVSFSEKTAAPLSNSQILPPYEDY